MFAVQRFQCRCFGFVSASPSPSCTSPRFDTEHGTRDLTSANDSVAQAVRHKHDAIRLWREQDMFCLRKKLNKESDAFSMQMHHAGSIHCGSDWKRADLICSNAA